jgi:hypothetical protein
MFLDYRIWRDDDDYKDEEKLELRNRKEGKVERMD